MAINHVSADWQDELLTGGQCDKMTREKVFQTLFAIFHFDVEVGELGLKGEASEDAKYAHPGVA